MVDGPPRDPSHDTQALVDAARRGDTRAWQALDARFRRALSSLARRRRPLSMQGRIGTEDLVQSTFLGAYRSLAGYQDRGPGSFLSWLKVILRNRVTERIRGQAAQRRTPEREEPLEAANGRAQASDPSPSGAAEQAETYTRLLDGVSDLPSELRDVIVLHFFEGLPTRRIAERLGTSETSVRRRIGRGLDLLKSA